MECAEGRIEKRTAQEEASWRERALNAEDEIRNLRREVATRRQLVGDLLGQLREPDGTPPHSAVFKAAILEVGCDAADCGDN
jgi:hypothetical protein